MVFVLLIALFIAFNYLLWDRESKANEIKSLEYTNATNSASINSQNREIKQLEDENNKFQADMDQLERDKELLQQKNMQLESEKLQTELETRHKIDIINVLKQNADIKVFETPARNWAEAVNSGNYAEAYKLEFNNPANQDKPISQSDYSDNFKNTVKSIKIKEIKLDPDAGKPEGKIILAAVLEVELVENADAESSRFVHGLNQVNFTLDYEASKNEFYIVEITKVP